MSEILIGARSRARGLAWKDSTFSRRIPHEARPGCGRRYASVRSAAAADEGPLNNFGYVGMSGVVVMGVFIDAE